MFLVPVQSQDGVILLSLNEESNLVAPKTHIITDCWNSCKAIRESANNYTHLKI